MLMAVYESRQPWDDGFRKAEGLWETVVSVYLRDRRAPEIPAVAEGQAVALLYTFFKQREQLLAAGWHVAGEGGIVK